jgi:lipoprotein-anchoring transpeptidase ErfK/SrfK
VRFSRAATIPPGPQDPLKARWMGFNGGAGIHGTDDIGSLGSAASHGCIRMAIPDVVALYRSMSARRSTCSSSPTSLTKRA